MRRAPGVVKAADSARKLQATGDIANSLLHLQSQLKAIRYPERFPATVSELKAKGKCAVLLPVLGHLFLGGFSKLVAEKVAHSNPRMFGQSDADFVRSVFLFVKQDFGFRPHLSPQQFLNMERYTEQSLLFVRACADLCRAFHKEEARSRGLQSVKATRSAATAVKHGNTRHGQRPLKDSATTQSQHNNNNDDDGGGGDDDDDYSPTRPSATSVPRERPCPKPHAQPSAALLTNNGLSSNASSLSSSSSAAAAAAARSSATVKPLSAQLSSATKEGPRNPGPHQGTQGASFASKRQVNVSLETQTRQSPHVHRKPELHEPKIFRQPELLLPSPPHDHLGVERVPNHNRSNAQSGLSTKLLDLVRKIHHKMESSFEAVNARLSLLEARLDSNDTALSAQAKQMKHLAELLPNVSGRHAGPSLLPHEGDAGVPLVSESSVEGKRSEAADPPTAHGSTKTGATVQHEGGRGASSETNNFESVHDEGPAPLHQEAQSLVAMIAERIQESQRLLEQTRPVSGTGTRADGYQTTNRSDEHDHSRQ